MPRPFPCDGVGLPARLTATHPAEPGTLAVPDPLRRREAGGGGIGQATYAAQSFIRTRRRSNRSLRR